MRRRLFNAFCLLSLVLAVAVAALWVRSVWWAKDMVSIEMPADADDALVFSSGHGGLLITLSSVQIADYVGLWPPGYYADQAYGSAYWLPTVVSGEQWFIPYWIVLVFILGSPCFGMLRNGRIGSEARCPHCGYDLRGSAGPACPECGEATASTRSA